MSHEPKPKKPTGKAKQRRERHETSSDESDARPPQKWLKAAVRQAVAEEDKSDEQQVSDHRSAPRGNGLIGDNKANHRCYQCGQNGHWSMQCPMEARCYAYHRPGHFARECLDTEANARNDEQR